MTSKVNLILLLFLICSIGTLSPKSRKKHPVGDFEISFKNKNDFRDALLPVSKNAIFKMDGFYLWDPSVIKVKNTYHLFASRWPIGKGMNGWKESQIVRATSKSLYGPYKFSEVVLDASTHPWANVAVHNPKVTKVGNQFLLYYIGLPQYKTGFSIADNIEGPWKTIDKPVIPTNNPAFLQTPNGKFYAVGKYKSTPIVDGDRDCFMNAFESDSLLGPYKLIGGNTNRLPYDFELEDPTIWWANDQYNVVCTDWGGKVTGIEKATILYTSKDGINYKLYSDIPILSKEDLIPVRGGDSLKIFIVERPQVYTDSKGNVDALLLAVRPTSTDPSYIVIRPVKKYKPSNK